MNDEVEDSKCVGVSRRTTLRSARGEDPETRRSSSAQNPGLRRAERRRTSSERLLASS